MIKREWLLGVGLLSGGMLSAGMIEGIVSPNAAQADDIKIGAVGAVNTTATGQLQGAASQTLFVGSGVFQNQTVRTDAGGLARDFRKHALEFAIQSAAIACKRTGGRFGSQCTSTIKQRTDIVHTAVDRLHGRQTVIAVLNVISFSII